MRDATLALGSTSPSLERELEPLAAALSRDPTDASALRTLFDLYQRHGLVDRACCVAEALMALHKASPGQTLWRGQHRPRALPAAHRPLDTEVIRDHVAHPDQDRYVTAVLSIIAPALATWRAHHPPRALAPADRVDISTAPSDAARMVEYARRTLAVDAPDLYLRRDEHGDHVLLNLERGGRLRPTLVLFDRLLDRRQEPELGFSIGRAMADLLPPHFAFVALERSPASLRLVLEACQHHCGRPSSSDAGALDAIAHEVFGRLPTEAREQVGHVLRLATRAGSDLDAERWAAHAELTACRVGLLLSGDLHRACRALRLESSPLCAPTRFSATERRDELIRYGISESYFFARTWLGIDATL